MCNTAESMGTGRVLIDFIRGYVSGALDIVLTTRLSCPVVVTSIEVPQNSIIEVYS